ncbi:MAG: hypothetical protein FJ253_12045, partial [Phycisphaerae bacterium]|nr:hypothetical protein [Phycisphaerae bacterium]
MALREPTPNEDWTDEELRLVVDDYFAMLGKELAGEPYVKSEHRRSLARRLPARTEGSIEFKHQNISAALEALGLDYIDGYKPRRNFQRALLPLLYDRTRTEHSSLRESLVTPYRAAMEPTTPIDPEAVLVSPPLREAATWPVARDEIERWTLRMADLVDWRERDARARALGLAGEEFVVRFEQMRLESAGQSALARR